MWTAKKLPAARGRPVAVSETERRERILTAAEICFDRVGYGATTMDLIARECGMSKATIYRLYSDKGAIFSDMVQRFGCADLSDLRIDPSLPARGQMRILVLAMARFILAPRQIGLTRLVIAEARKSPELADLFYANCIAKSRCDVLDKLRQISLASPVGLKDPTLVVDLIIGAVLGPLHVHTLIRDQNIEDLMPDVESRTEAILALVFPAAPDHPQAGPALG